MRRAFALLALLVLLAAGCITPEDTGPGTNAPSAGGNDGYTLSCDGLAKGNGSWQEPCLAMASPNDSPSKAEIDLAVNPMDPSNVVVGSKDLDPLASSCVWAVPEVSKDGGATWQTVYIGGKKADRKPTEPLFGWSCITDPIMAFAPDGTLYYSLQAYDYAIEGSQVPLPPGAPIGATIGSAILAARSKDGGATWDKIVTLHLGEGNAVFHDFMRVVVNPKTGTYHTIWNQYSQAVAVPVLVSWDGKADRANPPVYVPVPDKPGDATMAGFAVDAEGTLYVLIDATGGDGYLTISKDDGKTFSTPKRIEQLQREPIKRQALGGESFRTTGSYELAVDTSGGERNGWVYATISEQDGDANADLYVSHSEDGGATWSNRTLLNAGEHQPGFQWMGRPYVDRDGTLHVVYLDSSRNAGNDTIVDASWARSTDGGTNWTNAYLTAKSFDGNLGIHQDGFPFLGDYLGIGGAGEWLYMGFPDCSTGRCEIGVAKVKLP